MSLRVDWISLSGLLLILAAGTNAAGQGCERAETKHVRVSFSGCATAEPDLSFDVYVGDDRITVSKSKKEERYWSGETQETFTIGTRALRIPSDAVPRALVACDTKAEAVRDGACVAVYQVKCEPLWFVDIALVPQNDNAPFLRYERTGSHIAACERDEPPQGPGEIDVTDTECLFVTFDQPMCQIKLSKGSFKRKGELTLADVPVHAVNNQAAISEGIANDNWARSALQKRVKELRFTKKAD